MKGFIVGYWNGDGNISSELVKVSSASSSILIQVRNILSYFNISSTFKEINIYQCKPSYVIAMSGKNMQSFLKIFYNREHATSGKSKIINNNHFSILPITNFEREYYNGVVYNLEVEEDNSYSLMNATIHNCFSSDSDGFFKASLINECVVSQPIRLSTGTVVEPFSATLFGDRRRDYVFGIDPASQEDNFAIVILELHDDHARVVHVWTTNADMHKERINQSRASKSASPVEGDFFAFCTRKIRDLMAIFPCKHIAMDSQGGGRTIAESLHNDKYLEGEESLIWEINDKSPLWDKKNRDTDSEAGSHILELVNFRDNTYTCDANHGMKNDLEKHLLLFPFFDAIEIVLAGKDDMEKRRDNDTLEDCVMEIEETKNELTIIKHSQTEFSHLEKWGTPEKKEPGQKKGRLHDDRYSALLMANMAARRLRNKPKQVEYVPAGGFVGQIKPGEDKNLPLYIGPSWFTEGIKESGGYGTGIKR
jgi:hypothetical protein